MVNVFDLFKLSYEMIAVLCFVWVLMIGVLIYSLFKPKKGQNVSKRLELNSGKKFLLESRIHKSVFGKIYDEQIEKYFKQDSFFSKIGSFIVKSKEVKKGLEAVDSNFTLEEFIAIKVLSLFFGTLCLIIGLLLNCNLIIMLIGGILILLGLFLENQIYGDKLKKKNKQITKDLPEFLDLLYSACKVGQPPVKAIEKVSNKYTGQLSEEFKKMLISYRANGGDLKAAFAEMIERNQNEDLTNVLSDILISYEKGDSQVVETLKYEANEMRLIRDAKREEALNKKQTQLLIPMMIFLFLPILAFLLIPLISQFLIMFNA